jgi:ATP synthase protein I
MHGNSGNPKDVQRAFAIAAVGMEMVIPALIGWWLDSRFQTGPWGALIGGVVGFTGGIWHMLRLGKQDDSPRNDKPDPPRIGS